MRWGTPVLGFGGQVSHPVEFKMMTLTLRITYLALLAVAQAWKWLRSMCLGSIVTIEHSLSVFSNSVHLCYYRSI